MNKRTMNGGMILDFSDYLISEEKSQATVSKYQRDLFYLMNFISGRPVTKALTLEYKSHLGEKYAPTSANSMIAAMNGFFRYMGWYDLTVKQFRVQERVYRAEEKDLTRAEYARLIAASERKGREQVGLMIETIYSTGIRVSELQFITLEAAKRGEAAVRCKGKCRPVHIVKELRDKLISYAARKGITEGCIFVTRNGRPISRTNIWRAMKSLCKDADVAPSKVFPHNLRHLFAKRFYEIKKDIARLACILGHANINTTRIYVRESFAQYSREMEQIRLLL